MMIAFSSKLILLLTIFLYLSKTWDLATASSISSFSDDDETNSLSNFDDEADSVLNGNYEDDNDDDYDEEDKRPYRPLLRPMRPMRLNLNLMPRPGFARQLSRSKLYQSSQNWKQTLEEWAFIPQLLGSIALPFLQRRRLAEQYRHYLMERPPELAGIEEEALYQALPQSAKKALAPIRQMMMMAQMKEEREDLGPDLLITHKRGFSSSMTFFSSGPLLLFLFVVVVLLILVLFIMRRRRSRRRKAEMTMMITKRSKRLKRKR